MKCEAFQIVWTWIGMGVRVLELAVEKTEAVVLTRRRKNNPMSVGTNWKYGNSMSTVGTLIKYHGVKMMFTNHADHVVKRARGQLR